jgi:hypothetical protein
MVKEPEVIASQVAIDAESIRNVQCSSEFQGKQQTLSNFGKNGSERRRSPQGSQTQPGLGNKRRLVGEITKYVN